MKIEILGTGCARCRQTAEIVRQAVLRSGTEASIRKVEDVREIAMRNVMMTPAVAIDGKVRISGRVPSVEEMEAILAEGNGC